MFVKIYSYTAVYHVILCIVMTVCPLHGSRTLSGFLSSTQISDKSMTYTITFNNLQENTIILKSVKVLKDTVTTKNIVS